MERNNELYPVNEFMKFFELRGIGRRGQFDFSCRHYLHFTSKEIIKIMTKTYNWILESKCNLEYRQQILSLLYYTAKTDMIITLTFNKVQIPQVYYDIENLHNHYFPKVLGIRRV